MLLEGEHAGSPETLRNVALLRGDTENDTGEPVTGTPAISTSLMPMVPASWLGSDSKQPPSYADVICPN